ncbi:unnamed protein product, partial [Phaeothamnion confervicola]
RKEALPEYEREIRRREQRWFDDELSRNDAALRTMRTLVPADVATVTREQLEQEALVRGSLYPRELAIFLKENRLLQWCVTHPDDIARANFLVGEHAHFFTNLDKYDVTELRAVAACIPARFELDRDGRKAAWRADFMTRVQALVAQEKGDEVLGSWDPKTKARRRCRLPPLAPELRRRAVYSYPRPAEAATKLEKLRVRDAALASKKATLADLKDRAVPEAQLEYAAVLADTREEYFRASYSSDELRTLRAEAKGAVEALQKQARALERELQVRRR